MTMGKTFDELMAEARAKNPPRKPRTEPEHDLQVACVKWFGLQYPRLRGRLFAVPNGGHRSKTEAAKLKAEGVVPGVSDLILLKSNRDFGALLIEMKTTASGSRQSDRQREWQAIVTSLGEYKYVVCRTIEDFMCEVRCYLQNI